MEHLWMGDTVFLSRPNVPQVYASLGDAPACYFRRNSLVAAHPEDLSCTVLYPASQAGSHGGGWLGDKKTTVRRRARPAVARATSLVSGANGGRERSVPERDRPGGQCGRRKSPHDMGRACIISTAPVAQPVRGGGGGGGWHHHLASDAPSRRCAAPATRPLWNNSSTARIRLGAGGHRPTPSDTSSPGAGGVHRTTHLPQSASPCAACDGIQRAMHGGGRWGDLRDHARRAPSLFSRHQRSPRSHTVLPPSPPPAGPAVGTPSSAGGRGPPRGRDTGAAWPQIRQPPPGSRRRPRDAMRRGGVSAAEWTAGTACAPQTARQALAR